MNRPKIKVPLQQLDIALEFTTLSLLVLTCAFVIFNYPNLTETIPTHFNASGVADNFSHKSSIFIILGISIGIYILLLTANKFPHLHNYMVNITEENALKNYRISTRILRGVNLFSIAIMSYVTYIMITSSKRNVFEIEKWILPAILGFSIIFSIVCFIYIRKMNT
ncbi:MAG: DUF1648 domain-containing protein [Flavobacteriaceae bacterium]|nr:DUF1648 domain-containing protein [Flavobacteriaceae bacterium]